MQSHVKGTKMIRPKILNSLFLSTESVNEVH